MVIKLIVPFEEKLEDLPAERILRKKSNTLVILLSAKNSKGDIRAHIGASQPTTSRIFQ